jgi:hypothetical protein
MSLVSAVRTAGGAGHGYSLSTPSSADGITERNTMGHKSGDLGVCLCDPYLPIQ